MSNGNTITRAQLHAAFVEWETQRRADPREDEFQHVNDKPVSHVADIQTDYVFELVAKQAAAT